MHSAQIINSITSGMPEFAVLPYQDYLSLLALKAVAEGYDDVEDYLDYQEAANILEMDRGRIPFEEIKRSLNSAG